MSLRFEWDKKKAATNLRKHSVSFDGASTVFHDPLARIFDDEDHSGHEAREIIIGHSATGKASDGILYGEDVERHPNYQRACDDHERKRRP